MTIEEFSREIGLSTATISRAIHGRGRVSPETRAVVLQRMKELGYTPNLHAQRLVTGRSHMIALEFQDQTRLLADTFFVTLSGHIQQALREKGFGLLLNLMDGTEKELLLRQWVKSRAADGAILVTGSDVNQALLCELASVSPVVLINHHTVTGVPNIGCVVVGLERGARQVARHLVEQGHRSIGFIGSARPDQVFTGFRDELAALGVSIQNASVRFPGYGRENGARAMHEVLSSPARPTAVFCRTDAIAMGALRTAKERGLRVPHDLSLVGHDDSDLALWTDPPLTTVRVDCAELARCATESLVALLGSSMESTPPRIVETSLVTRDSVERRAP